MKFLLSLFIFSISFLISYSQQNYFVYLQTDNKQAFYIKLDDQLYSSSSSGYLVIPKLQNGTYNFSIGFPKAEWPQQLIAVSINNKDEGFLLKNFNEKGWGLFNMQNLDVLMAKSDADKKSTSVLNANDGFSDILAGVVNTPGLNQKEVEETKPVVVDTPTKKIEQVVKSVEPLVVNSVSITKLASAIDGDGRTLVYLDNLEEKVDTIRIFIPNETQLLPIVEKKLVNKNDAIEETSIIQNPAASNDTTKIAAVKEPPSEPGFLGIELPNPNSKRDTIDTNTQTEPLEKKAEPVLTVQVVSETVKETPKTSSISIINSDCKLSATEEDFLKLRKKMASYDKEEDMIMSARKNFKARCYSTEQVKNLSVLFLTDASKYQFFDMAYPFVHDSSNFGSLQNQLTDSYYLNRFKAMVRQ